MISAILPVLLSTRLLNPAFQLAGLTAWDWLLIFLAVVIVVWLLLIRNVRQSEREAGQFEAHPHEEHPE